MKKKIIISSNNENKIKEIRNKIKSFEIISLKESGIIIDIPEIGSSFQENASIKSNYIYNNYKQDCFSDDSGLEVFYLNMEPGVKSARYAGDTKNDLDNINKLLKNLKNKDIRDARFRTVISLILDGNEYFFEGMINGKITEKPIGKNGFGYDSIFIPNGYEKTFAEMTDEEKNEISHRALAIEKFEKFLNKLS